MSERGNARAETVWNRLIQERDEIEELADDIEVTTHNMWVDIRDGGPGFEEYDEVRIDVTVTVSEWDEGDTTIRPEFTTKQAEALLTYTKTALSGDDSFDEFRDKVSDARHKLEESLRRGRDTDE